MPPISLQLDNTDNQIAMDNMSTTNAVLFGGIQD